MSLALMGPLCDTSVIRKGHPHNENIHRVNHATFTVLLLSLTRITLSRIYLVYLGRRPCLRRYMFGVRWDPCRFDYREGPNLPGSGTPRT